MAFRSHLAKLTGRAKRALGKTAIGAVKAILLILVGLPTIMVHWIYIHIYRGQVLGKDTYHEPYFS